MVSRIIFIKSKDTNKYRYIIEETDLEDKIVSYSVLVSATYEEAGFRKNFKIESFTERQKYIDKVCNYYHSEEICEINFLEVEVEEREHFIEYCFQFHLLKPEFNIIHEIDTEEKEEREIVNK